MVHREQSSLRARQKGRPMTYNEQLAAIIAKITPVLKPTLDPETYAAGMIEEDQNEDGSFEVRGRHTKTGAPHAFTIG